MIAIREMCRASPPIFIKRSVDQSLCLQPPRPRFVRLGTWKASAQTAITSNNRDTMMNAMAQAI